jgi:hypothetical protein
VIPDRAISKLGAAGERPTALILFLSAPAIADDDDSTLEKAVKLKAVKEADNDSVLKKGAQLKMAKEVTDDEDDSTLKKAAKLKVLKEATENDDD